MKAAYIGRFQPFHEGHRIVIERYRDEHESLTVVVGSSGKSREEENPLSFDERREIIKSCHPETDVIPLEDEGSSEEANQKWAEKLEEKSRADAIITRNSLVARLVDEYTGMDVVEPERIGPDSYSGTEVRRRIRSGEEWRYLVPDCCQEKVEELKEVIKKSGREYSFEPGWKKENAYHGTE
ncbi:MAG: adenylyltransferase/cytidyltransferase family protein [Candidatus Nanohaloarchaea archaeon]